MNLKEECAFNLDRDSDFELLDFLYEALEDKEDLSNQISSASVGPSKKCNDEDQYQHDLNYLYHIKDGDTLSLVHDINSIETKFSEHSGSEAHSSLEEQLRNLLLENNVLKRQNELLKRQNELWEQKNNLWEQENNLLRKIGGVDDINTTQYFKLFSHSNKKCDRKRKHVSDELEDRNQSVYIPSS
ncbi:MAG: hypothetical protein Q8R83_11090 [Legionellaceae bacterium]|nr:hypothetical protein [Legionellaceae bacterium]